MAGRALVIVLVVLAGLGAVGCTAPAPAPGPSGAGPVQPPEPTAPVQVLAACPAAQAPAPADGLLTDVALPCLTGGHPVDLARLGRPAVINLWASWCDPCRDELPELQRLADVAGDEVVVLGVVTEDSEGAATALASDLGVTFPAVVDESGLVRRSAGQTGLPTTLFVDAGGHVRHVYAGKILTLESARDLVRTHLGVDVG